MTRTFSCDVWVRFQYCMHICDFLNALLLSAHHLHSPKYLVARRLEPIQPFPFPQHICRRNEAPWTFSDIKCYYRSLIISWSSDTLLANEYKKLWHIVPLRSARTEDAFHIDRSLIRLNCSEVKKHSKHSKWYCHFWHWPHHLDLRVGKAKG